MIVVVDVVAVCIYRLVMMRIDLSKKFTLHVQMVTGSTDVIVTQLLCYHMRLLYCMQPLIVVVSISVNELVLTHCWISKDQSRKRFIHDLNAAEKSAHLINLV